MPTVSREVLATGPRMNRPHLSWNRRWPVCRTLCLNNNNVTASNMVIVSNGEASTVDYQAGFTYNYQCSFSLLPAFVYVFIYKHVLSVVVLPLVWWLLKRLQMHSYVRYELSSAWYLWTTLCLPLMMYLLDGDEVEERTRRTDRRWRASQRGLSTGRRLIKQRSAKCGCRCE